MNTNSGFPRAILITSLISIVTIHPLLAAEKPSESGRRLAEYLLRARALAADSTPSPGSLWNPQGRMANLAIDYKARAANDIVFIRIIEQTTAQAAGSVQSQRRFESSSGIGDLFGPLGARSGLQGLFSPRSDRSLDGSAQTASNWQLATTLAGHVVEVLPNGYLVIEAAREVEMNNERQGILVRGVVRPGDVGPDNSVYSTAISHLEVELKGKGVISDGVRPPNRIIQALLRILGF